MIPQLLLAGAGVGYLVQRRRNKQLRYALKRSVQRHPPPGRIGQLLSEFRSAAGFSETERLRMELDPELRRNKRLATHRVRRQLRLSLGALGVSVLAAYQPFFLPFGVAAILYLSRENYRLLWRDFKRGHYLSFYLVGAIANLGMIATGHLILSAINGLVFGFLAGITNRLEDVAHNRLLSIFSNHPEQVWVVKDGVEVEVDYAALVVGDRVMVNAGEVIPVDGLVRGGIGQVDQHMLSGESQPVEKVEGDQVFAATLLLTGRLEVEVVTAGDETVATKITGVLSQTETYKDAMILRGRRIGDRFIPVKLGLATLAGSLLGPNAAMAVMWANLGNGLSTIGPMIVMAYLQLLARQQILIKDGTVFESLRKLDTLVFDKTGTLTDEQPAVGLIHTLNGVDETEVLRLAAAAEYRQPHPIARAIVARAKDEGISPPALDEASYEVGFGIKVFVEGKTVRAGSARFMQQQGIALPAEVDRIRRRAEADSHSLVFVSIDQRLAGVLELQPRIRPEAKQIVRTLRQRGLDLYIISGDHEAPTRRLAEALGIERYFSETLPENKAALVQQLRDEGRFVGFVGDGINDAIALKSAQVSISLKGASSAAIDTAQIILMDGSLRHLSSLFKLVDEFEATMRRATVIGFAPGTLTVGGIFFLHFGVVTSLFILYLNICLGLGNTLWPMIKHLPSTDASGT
jgi:heavy metal translocating P-type ATPase